MKFIVLIATLALGTSSFANQPLNNAPAQSGEFFNEREYWYLKGLCQTALQIISAAESNKYVPPGAPDNRVFRIETSFKNEAQRILSSGTPAARTVFAEYEAVHWKLPAIGKI
jgi:hypothetical protein